MIDLPDMAGDAWREYQEAARRAERRNGALLARATNVEGVTEARDLFQLDLYRAAQRYFAARGK